MAATKSTPSGKAAVKETAAAIAAVKPSPKRAAAKSDTPRSERKSEKVVAQPEESKASPGLSAGGEKTNKTKQRPKAQSATATLPADAGGTPRRVIGKPAGVPKKAGITEVQGAANAREGTDLPNQQEIDRMIAEAAYYLAEKRDFAPGWEQEDWETAKNEVMSRLQQGRT